jgi:hypothetical protein
MCLSRSQGFRSAREFTAGLGSTELIKNNLSAFGKPKRSMHPNLPSLIRENPWLSHTPEDDTNLGFPSSHTY